MWTVHGLVKLGSPVAGEDKYPALHNNMQILLQEVGKLSMSWDLGMHQMLCERKRSLTAIKPQGRADSCRQNSSAITQQQKRFPFLPTWVSSKWSPEGQEECGRTSSETLLSFALGQAKPLAASQSLQSITRVPSFQEASHRKLCCLPKVER